jgi:exopolyphosphatase/pppGpp-phosphohydrolase
MACRVWLRDYLKAQVVPLLKPALSATRRPVRLVGTGGSATILGRIQAKLDDFDRDLVQSHWQMTLAQRQNIVGLPPDRADVILTGMAIYEAIMEQFAFKELALSTRGLRYWALLHPS